MEMSVGTHHFSVPKSDSWTEEQYRKLADKMTNMMVGVPIIYSKKQVIVDRAEFLTSYTENGQLYFRYRMFGHEESWRDRQPLL